MKKLLLSSIILLLFSSSILIFQVSCQKEAKADINNTNELNKLVFVKSTRSSSGSIYEITKEIWTSNIDGSNQSKVNITIPSGKRIDEENVNITSDGTKVILVLQDSTAQSTSDIYSCNLDGSNLIRIVGNSTNLVEYTSVRSY